jgi:hypothetical protein
MLRHALTTQMRSCSCWTASRQSWKQQPPPAAVLLPCCRQCSTSAQLRPTAWPPPTAAASIWSRHGRCECCRAARRRLPPSAWRPLGACGCYWAAALAAPELRVPLQHLTAVRQPAGRQTCSRCCRRGRALHWCRCGAWLAVSGVCRAVRVRWWLLPARVQHMAITLLVCVHLPPPAPPPPPAVCVRRPGCDACTRLEQQRQQHAAAARATGRWMRVAAAVRAGGPAACGPAAVAVAGAACGPWRRHTDHSGLPHWQQQQQQQQQQQRTGRHRRPPRSQQHTAFV